MIKELTKEELINSFSRLLTEIEFGEFHDDVNTPDEEIIQARINKYYELKFTFYGFFDDETKTPVALISVKINSSPFYGKSMEIMHLGVVKEFRRKKIGSDLISYIEKTYKSQKPYAIFVKTHAKSYKTIAFFGKNGYFPIAVIPETHGPKDEGTLVMRKKMKK